MEKRVFDLQIAAESNIGLNRSGNEDSFLVCRPDDFRVLACVADGIGSHSDGKLASSICCRDLMEMAMAESSDLSDAENFLKNSFSCINEKIFERNYRERRLSPMGCTAVAALFSRETITVLNIGDSRFYEYLPGRSEPLKQITVDHHPDDELLEKLSAAYSVDKKSLQKRVLMHSLGTNSQLFCDIFTVPLQAGARYLLCSDGLSGRVPGERIAAVLANETLSARQMTSALIREALLCGSRDNITVITAELKGDDHGIA